MDKNKTTAIKLSPKNNWLTWLYFPSDRNETVVRAILMTAQVMSAL